MMTLNQNLAHKELIVLDYDRPLQFNEKLLGKT